jgi:hypothetical protein
MSPPGVVAEPGSGCGSWHTEANSLDKAINAAHLRLADQGIQMSPRKVSRLIRAYLRADTAQQRRRPDADPELARVIAYLDITGETAAFNVDREQARPIGAA